MLDMKKVEKIFNKGDELEIEKFYNSFPKDVWYFAKLGKVNLGSIWESYHVGIEYDNNQHTRNVVTDYKIISSNCLDANNKMNNSKYCDNLEDAKNFILSIIPKECWKYVKFKRTVFKD